MVDECLNVSLSSSCGMDEAGDWTEVSVSVEPILSTMVWSPSSLTFSFAPRGQCDRSCLKPSGVCHHPTDGPCMVRPPVTCQPQLLPLFTHPLCTRKPVVPQTGMFSFFWARKHMVSCFSCSPPNPIPPNATTLNLNLDVPSVWKTFLAPRAR